MELQVGKAYRTKNKLLYFLVCAIKDNEVWGSEVYPSEKYVTFKSYIGLVSDIEQTNPIELEKIHFLDKMKAVIGKIQSEYEKLKNKH